MHFTAVGHVVDSFLRDLLKIISIQFLTRHFNREQMMPQPPFENGKLHKRNAAPCVRVASYQELPRELGVGVLTTFNSILYGEEYQNTLLHGIAFLDDLLKFAERVEAAFCPKSLL